MSSVLPLKTKMALLGRLMTSYQEQESRNLFAMGDLNSSDQPKMTEFTKEKAAREGRKGCKGVRRQ